MKKDFRSPVAKARDDWMESRQGKAAVDPSILFTPRHAPFLRNRIELAFVAGANWAAIFLAKKAKRK